MIQWLLIATRWIINNKGSSNCWTYPGCTFESIKPLFVEGDSLVCTERYLDQKQTLDVLNFLNSTRSGIHISGAPTIFDGSTFQATDVCLDYTNRTIEIESITFWNFRSGILHCDVSSVRLNNVVFDNCSFAHAAPLAFVESNISLINTLFNECEGDGQSIMLGYKCNVNIIDSGFISCQIGADFACPVIHFLQTHLSIENTTIEGSDVDYAFLVVSNSSDVSIENSTFKANHCLTLSLFEYDTNVVLKNVIIRDTNGSLVFASGGVNLVLNDVLCEATLSSRYLILLNETNLKMAETFFKDARIPGAIIGHNSIIRMDAFTIDNVFARLPIFNLTRTETHASMCVFKNVSSASEVIAFAHSFETLVLSECHFTNISTTRDASTAVSVWESPLFRCDFVTFEQSRTGFCICERTNVTIFNSYVKNNQYFPVNQSLPYAIVVISEANCVEVEHTQFIDNRAVTGTFLLLNSTAQFINSSFRSNNAVQGAAIFASDCSIYIELSTFHKNMALANGGALSLLRSKSMIKTTQFHYNQADEGGAIYAINCSSLAIRRSESKGNEAADGVFIYSRGDSLITLEKTRSGVFPDKAISVSRPDLVELLGTFFNCQMYCELIDELGTDSRGASETPLTLVFGAILLIAIVGFAVTTRSCKRTFFRLFKSKGKHIL